MPGIIKRQRTVTGEAPSVKAPLSLGSDVAAAGREFVGKANSLIIQHRERQRVQDRKNKSSAVETAYDDEQRAYSSGEFQKTGSDSYGSIERAEKFRSESIERHTKGIEDPELKTRIEDYISGRSGNMMDSLSRYQASQRGEVTRQANEGKINGILKDSFDGLEPVQDSLDRWEKTIGEQREVGLIGEEDAVDLVVKGQQQIAEASLDGVVNRDPTMAIELIKAGAYDEFLSQKQIKAFDKQAKAMQKAMVSDAESRAKEQEKAEKDALKENQRAIGDEFVSANVSGALTKEQVLKSVLDPTGENSKEHWLKEIERRSKQVEKDVDKEWETKPVVEADLIQRITENPESVKDSDITNKLGKGLDSDTAKQLLNFKQKRIKGDVSSVKIVKEKTASKRLLDAKNAGLFDPSDETNNEKLWAEASIEVEKFKNENPNEDPNDLVTSMIVPISNDFAQTMMNIFNVGQPGTEQAKQQRREELGSAVSAIEEEKEAIKFLEDNGQNVTDDNIKFVMEHK